MNTLLSYLIQMTLVSGLLYGYYHFVLRNQRFHAYNRFFLLAAVLCSFLIPLLNIPLYFRSAPVIQDWSFGLDPMNDPHSKNKVGLLPSAENNRPFTTILLYLAYILTSLVVASRLFLSLAYIRRLRYRYKMEKIGHVRFFNTREPGTPFSFFNWMFWDQRMDPLSSQGKQVFRHEMFHINQRHSLDILFMEAVTMAAWFNPFYHLYKKELKAIHEFLADEYAMQETGPATYAELLLIRVLKTRTELVNPFFHNQIKRRLHMILKDQTPAPAYLRKVMVLPLVFLSLLLFAFNYKTREPKQAALPNLQPLHFKTMTADTSRPGQGKPSRLLVVIDDKSRHIVTNDFKDSLDKLLSPDQIERVNILKGEAAIKKYGKEWEEGVVEITTKPRTSLVAQEKEKYITVNGMPLKDSLKTGKFKTITDSAVVVKGYKIERDDEQENKLFSKVEIEASFPGGNEAFQRFLQTNLNRNTGKSKGAPAGNYSVVIQFVVDLDGNLSDIRPLTNHGFGMEEEAIRVLKLSPNWVPAVQNGRKVVAYRKQVFNFF